MDKPIKRGFFGYKKSSVNVYIKEMNESASRMLEEKNAEINALRGECAKLREQKDAIAEAIMAAKKRAKEIIASSEKEAEQKREELKAEYSRETENIDKIRTRISEVRNVTAKTLKTFNEDLNEIESSLQRERRAASAIEDEMSANDISDEAVLPTVDDEDINPPSISKPTIIKIR